MIIKIQWFPEAKDEMDADAQTAEVTRYADNADGAIEEIGDMERFFENLARKAPLPDDEDEELVI